MIVFPQESAAVIVALFELNTPEFSMMLTVLPKSFQVINKMLRCKTSLSFSFCFSLRYAFTRCIIMSTSILQK